MKKIALLFSAIVILITNLSAQDKAFQKGDFSIGLGAGFGVYQTTSTYSINAIDPNGDTYRLGVTDQGGAAAAIFPLTLEYGLTNWFGLGARAAYSNYATNGDSTNNNIKPKVYAFDGDLTLNFHFIKTVHFDMPLVIIAGYSAFTYKTNDALQNKAKDGGFNYGFMLNPRILFGDHIGMFFNLGYMGYNYPSMVYSNMNDSNLNDNYQDDLNFTLKGSGANIGLGLIVKF